MTKFQVGRTYFDRSACDHDCVFTMKVVGRTAKTVQVDLGHRGLKTLRVAAYGDVETVKPFGTYSMCTVMRADRFQA